MFVTGVGSGTTYPDYKPAPFIVSSQHEGVDMVTVVTEGIFSYCSFKVKIDTDRYHRPRVRAGARARRGGGPRHDDGVRLADAVARRRAPSHRRQQEGGPRHLRRDVGARQPAARSSSRSKAAPHSSCRPGAPPVDQRRRPSSRMRVGCGSATIGIFAQQWFGHVDEVIVVDDHITGVLTRASGRALPRHAGRRRSGCAGRKSTPGRYFQVANPGLGLGRHRHHRSAEDHQVASTARRHGRASGS